MARIRSIKPEFWVSEQVAECSTSARLTFVGLWNFCDDRGVHPAKPKTLKAELYPMDDVTSLDVAAWIAELIRVGLICEFTADDGDVYWHVTGWDRHQKIDRPSFKHPAPPPLVSTTDRRTVSEDSSNARRAPPPGVEGSGVEGKGVESTSPKAPTPDSGSSTGTRLSHDWTLPEAWRAYCVDKRPDLDPDAVAENFRDFWLGKAGKDGRKADWLVTWQRWVRNERYDGAQARAGTGVRRPALHSDDLLTEDSP